jgi:hypothetical protein
MLETGVCWDSDAHVAQEAGALRRVGTRSWSQRGTSGVAGTSVHTGKRPSPRACHVHDHIERDCADVAGKRAFGGFPSLQQKKVR